MKALSLTQQARVLRLAKLGFVWLGAIAAGCSSNDDSSSSSKSSSRDDGGRPAAGGKGGKGSNTQENEGGRAGGSTSANTSTGRSAVQTGQGGGSGSSGDATVAAAPPREGGQPAPSGDKPNCGPNDNPEKGLQGAANQGTVNCGLTLLSELPGGGDVQGSGHCAYVRANAAAYGAGQLTAYSIADPLKPVMTDTEPGVGGSESMRVNTVGERAILASGRGVYDLSKCEDIVKKGEIKWPSDNAMNGLFFAALSSHELAVSHDAKRVYTGLGFTIAYIDDLEHPESWTVKDWACEMNKQSNFPTDVPNSCDGPVHQDIGRQYSHSSDDNLEGTVRAIASNLSKGRPRRWFEEETSRSILPLDAGPGCRTSLPCVA